MLFPEKIVTKLIKSPIGARLAEMIPPETLIAPAGIPLLIGGTLLIIGFYTRYAALLLIAVLLPITLTGQIGTGDPGPLLKNIALMGALFYFYSNGSSQWVLRKDA